MGLETVCTVLYGGEVYEPKVLLETDALIFRGALKRTVPFRDMGSVEAEDGVLRFVYGRSAVEVRVGEKAAVWAEKIRNPKTLLDKLGVKPGDTVALVGVTDEAFRTQLVSRKVDAGEGVPAALVAWVFFQAETCEDLERLEELRAAILPNGAIWVIHPKGRQDIKDLHVFAAAKAAGLVDVKVVAFSPTHSALKLVLPRSQRG